MARVHSLGGPIGVPELELALEPSAIYGDVKPEVEALELLQRIEER
jgi:hypothetical protein